MPKRIRALGIPPPQVVHLFIWRADGTTSRTLLRGAGNLDASRPSLDARLKKYSVPAGSNHGYDASTRKVYFTDEMPNPFWVLCM